MALMEAAAGHTLDDAGVGLAHAVYRETDGNPFFVSEVLRHLSETGAIHQDATGRWRRRRLWSMALPDSVREVIGARVGRLGKEAERVLSMAAVIGRDFDLDLLARATKTSEDELLDILDAACGRGPRARAGRYAGATASPTPSSSTRCTRTSVPPVEPGRTDRWPRLWRTCAGTAPAPGWANSPATGPAPPSPSTSPRPSATPARRATPPLLPWPLPTPCATTPRPSISTRRRLTPIPSLGIDLAIGLGTAQRQTGDPAFRDTLLDAARQAADLGDTERLVAAAMANNRGFVSAVGTIDADKVEILEMALDRLPADTPTGPSCSPPCAGTRLRQSARSPPGPGPTRPWPSPGPLVTMP